MSRKVAILYGGLSTEREISLKTGRAVFDAIQATNFEAVLVDADRQLAEKMHEIKPDVAFIALHGKFGEDGCVQGLLEILGIPYTGPGVMASSLAMNKIMTKKILAYEGIPTPGFMSISAAVGSPDDLAGLILDNCELPLVLKAPNQGSSIGVCFAFKPEDVASGVQECIKYDTEILVEEFIKGRELTASVLGNDNPEVLPLLEITSTTGVYDYTSKYTVGLSSHFVPELPEDTEQEIRDMAVKTYKAVGCAGLSRVDFLLSDDNKAYVIEINTSPGMTETSLFPDAARAAGISFSELVEKLINLAIEAHRR